jgi:uncharacterized metal-binding protein
MPGARTHDLITFATGVILAPIAQAVQVAALGLAPLDARPNSAWLVIGHLISGVMFSPDLDLDSAIDDRWGVFFWIWRPYMWLVPHRSIWSHSLIIAPLLRLTYFYFALLIMLIGGTWLLGQVGIVLPDYYRQLSDEIGRVQAENPAASLAFLVGFCTGSAAHSIADWLVTGGKHILYGLGLRVTRDYRDHDRYVPRQRRR